MAAQQGPADLEAFAAQTAEQFKQVNERVDGLVEQLEELADQITELAAQLEGIVQPAAPAESPVSVDDGIRAGDTPTPPQAVTEPKRITPGLAKVIKLVYEGHTTEAQAELKQLPATELAGQPAVVSLVAAGLFTQHNDYQSALVALKRARKLTNDPRLIKVVKLVEEQVAAEH